MPCPHCEIGNVFLHVERDNDRARLQCAGPAGPARGCGWASEWMTMATAEALVWAQCEALRGYALIAQDRAAERANEQREAA